MTCPDGCVAAAIDWKSIVRDAAPVVSWLLVILGWYFVSRDHNARERRKEVRAVISDLARDIQSIESKSHAHLATDGGSPQSSALELQLRSALSRLGLALERLKKTERLDVASRLIELRQAVSKEDFESRLRTACTPESYRPHEVSAAANALIDAIESTFRQLHP